jgi:Tfp pilus assembly protein PilO
MKGSDKGIIFGVVIAIVLVGFYVKVLSPKREKASALSADITKLKSDIDVQEQNVAYGEDARKHFPAYYGRMVVLGKAVPEQADTASLLVQLSSISSKTQLDFRGLNLSEGGESAADASSSSSSSSTTDTATTSSSTDSSSSSSSTTASSTTTTPAPATETSAANVPIGSAVGPGGLLTLPYALTFEGSFFDVTSFFDGLDSLNHVRDGGAMVAADGRLMTVDGFSLTPKDQISGSPSLDVALAVTTYMTPGDQGLTAGASPSGPSPSLSTPETQTTSATVSP